MSETASIVVFGAGCIGRGLLGELAARGGRSVIFVEGADALASALTEAGQYNIRLVGRSNSETTVSGFRVLTVRQKAEIAQAIGNCGLIATAVGGERLGQVAPLLAEGLTTRRKPVNILTCENWPAADRTLADAIVACGVARDRFTCVATSVERMVRASAGTLDLVGESDETLFYDQTQWIGPNGGLPGLNPCADLAAYSARKLYTNNAGHAVLAYEGFLAGHEFLPDAHAHSAINGRVAALLASSAEMLAREYGLDRTNLREHVHALVAYRFANHELADPVRRVGRDPLRKLSPDDRLVGLLRRLIKHNLAIEPACRAIAAAMHYADPADAQAIRMHEMIASAGPESVLCEVCRISPREKAHGAILSEWHNISKEHLP